MRRQLAGLIVLVTVLSSDGALGVRACGNEAACCNALNKFWMKKAYNRSASIKKEIPIRDTPSATLSIAFSCPSPHSGLAEGIKFLHDFSKSGHADIDYYEYAMSLSKEKGYTIALQPLPGAFARLSRRAKVIALSTHNMLDRMPAPMVASIIVQELNAEILEEAEGALWRREMIIRTDNLPPMIRVVVGVDPPASSSGESALAGIVVAGLGVDRRGYVLADYSGRMSPGQWGRKVVEAYDRFRADRIIAEGNQGGEMVRHTIQTVRENVPVTIVHASRAKQARAEPVAALYEQGKVDHAGSFPELEDEMCTWEPLSGMPSPDRLDALVWALTDLAIGGGPLVYAQAEEQFVCEPMRIPSIWQRVYAIDFDHAWFAAVWGAHDRSTGSIYLYDAYLGPRTDFSIHADEVRRSPGSLNLGREADRKPSA